MVAFEIYVKPTSNSQGMQLTSFEELSPEWTGERAMIPFGPDQELKEVVGWTDLFGGSACSLHIVKVRAEGGEVGYLVYGGNSGVRILDADAEGTGYDAHLPPGYGMPIIWVEDLSDLSQEVQVVIESGSDTQ